MIYPTLVNEPNYVLIGISAVLGLMVLITIYYVIQNKPVVVTARPSISVGMVDGSKKASSVQPADNSGYYASATPTASTSTYNKITSSSPQVFNIKENIYAFDDAEAVCGAMGAKVATIDQLIEAHKNGADWCNVGWTKDGLAAYPIQFSTWKNLQNNVPGRRNICGKPGINLVRNNPNLLYGVNCYGIKPEPKGNEKVKQAMLSDSQIAVNAKIAEFQKNLNKIGVLPFNQDTWSE